MGNDMMVALGAATVKGQTVFGGNSQVPMGLRAALFREAGRDHALGETVTTQFLEIPQARQTFTVLGCRAPGTERINWGLRQGINEHQLAAGCCSWKSKLPPTQSCLTGPDLVRLALERCRSARQAFELITGLIAKHGQGEGENDSIFLVADPQEAYLVEAAGSSWASLECRDVRAVSDVGLIRQDWQRIAPGIADHAITKGWWQDDGSKLDFSGSLGLNPMGKDSALRRWGRATLLLEQHHGNLEAIRLRQLLRDHSEGTDAEATPRASASLESLCRHPTADNPTVTGASFIAELTASPLPIAWWSPGPPCSAVYLPIFLVCDLPESLTRTGAGPAGNPWVPLHRKGLPTDPARDAQLHSSLALLQARIDQETEEFVAEAAALLEKGEGDKLRRQAGLFMQNHLELLEAEGQRWQVLAPTLALSGV